jgi:hypothetical protein
VGAPVITEMHVIPVAGQRLTKEPFKIIDGFVAVPESPALVSRSTWARLTWRISAKLNLSRRLLHALSPALHA